MTWPVRTRAEAKAAGKTKYFTGVPCVRGHIAERWIAAKTCCECQKIFEKKPRNRDPEERYRANAKYLKANREKARSWSTNRRARVHGAGGSHSAEDIKDIVASQRGRCAYCGIKMKTPHMDHVVPIIRGGSNDRRNLQALCKSCNSRKSSRDPLEYARVRGLLL